MTTNISHEENVCNTSKYYKIQEYGYSINHEENILVEHYTYDQYIIQTETMNDIEADIMQLLSSSLPSGQ